MYYSDFANENISGPVTVYPGTLPAMLAERSTIGQVVNDIDKANALGLPDDVLSLPCTAPSIEFTEKLVRITVEAETSSLGPLQILEAPRTLVTLLSGESAVVLTTELCEGDIALAIDGISAQITVETELIDSLSAGVRGLVLHLNCGIKLGSAIPLQASCESLEVEPFTIVPLGITVSLQGIELWTDLTKSAPASWMVGAGFWGVHAQFASIEPVPDSHAWLGSLSATNLSIGSTGLTGHFSAKAASDETAFFGFPFSLLSTDINIRQGGITTAKVLGTLQLPGAPKLNVEIGFDLAGAILMRLVPTAQPVVYDLAGVLSISLSSIELKVNGDSGARIVIAGGVTCQLLNNIGFDINSLSISSGGDLELEGGWVDLPKSACTDFCGFQFQVEKFGISRLPSGRQWVGFSGTVNLMDGLPAGASADGLRFEWESDNEGKPVLESISVSFEGIGVSFTVPGVFSFDGKVSYRKKDGNDEFAGAIQIQLISLNVTVAGQVVFGQHNGSKYMAVYLGADLPSAIPFFSTGLGIYGFTGLTALNFAPNKPPGIPWYSGDPAIPDWFHKPKVGIQDLTKWTPKSPSFALGAGITLGTLQDNGKAFSGKFLLVITLPGPVVLLQGMANIMKPRTELDKEADFKALAVLDVPAGIVQFGLDAKYAYKENGALLKIAGSAETMFHLDDASSWYVHVGKDKPTSARIQAQILSLFSANAYLMIDMDHATGFRIRTGAWAGFKKEWSFKVVSIKLEASVDGNVLMSLSPPQFHGDMTLQASASVKAFGVGIGLGVHAALKVDVMDPFKVTGDLSVSTELPWPLGKWSKTMKVTWAKPAAAKIQSDDGAKPVAGGDGSTDWPPIALPLKDAAIGHHNVAVAWPLTRTAVAPGAAGLISPNYEVKPGFRCAEEPTAVSGVVAPDLLPVVPVDSRIEMNFSRSVSVAGTWAKGFGKPASDGIDLIGDPSAKEKANVVVHHELAGLELEVWDGADWLTVAESGPGLEAQWQDVGLDSDGKTVQTKLWVGADTPYDFMTPALDGSAQAKLSSKGPDLLGVFSTELPKIHGGNRTRPRSSAKGQSAKRSPLQPVQPPIAQPVLYTLGQAAIPWPPTDHGTAIDGKPARHVSFGDVEVTWVAGKTDPEVVTSQRTPVLAQRGGTVQFSKKLMFHADKAGRDLWCVDVLMPNHLNGGVVVFMEGSALVTAFNASDGQLADILWSSPAPQLNLTMPNIARIRFQSAKEFSLLGFKVLPS